LLSYLYVALKSDLTEIVSRFYTIFTVNPLLEKRAKLLLPTIPSGSIFAPEVD
jgi:hypothetical protein